MTALLQPDTAPIWEAIVAEIGLPERYLSPEMTYEEVKSSLED